MRTTSRPANGRSSACTREEQHDSLKTVVEGDIIPRLMMLHRDTQAAGNAAAQSAHGTGAGISPEGREIFLELLHGESLAMCQHFISRLRAEGVPLEAIYTDLMAPTARTLGDMWSSDQISFVDVTIGVGRLQELLHALRVRQQREDLAERAVVLLATVPGEQHTFGMFMLAEMLRDAGLAVDCLGGGTATEVADRVRDAPYRIVGFSLSSTALIDSLGTAIGAVRSRSCVPDLRVMVGGSTVSGFKRDVRRLGVDLVAEDAAEALSFVLREAASQQDD